jgi:hypothetical protein
LTFNQGVPGSNPGGLTNVFGDTTRSDVSVSVAVGCHERLIAQNDAEQ